MEWRPIASFAIGVETVYRLQDIGQRGFWRATARSGDGIAGAAGVSLTSGRSVDGRWPSPRRPEGPPLAVPGRIAGNAADVVHTALAALGTPYVWGGTAANGFDCSGLVQWAYGQHGIRLPRMSRDHARSGTEVTPLIEALQPGDVLLFAAQQEGSIKNIGMYVSEQTFIRSSNTDAKMSRLVA